MTMSERNETGNASGTTLRQVWTTMRPILGWICIALGVVGFILPVLQGTLFMAIGVALVGRRNPTLRWMRVHLKLILRHWANIPYPIIGKPGLLALRAQQNISRQGRSLRLRFARRPAEQPHA